MRVVVQTVYNAKVEINKKVVGEINHGYLLLVGFTTSDNKLIVDKMVDKILSLRVFPDENRQINLSIYDINGDILSVSQFTLYADASKGRRPSFICAMRPAQAEELYDYFNSQLEAKFAKEISRGIFGADMMVTSTNDGPFTLLLDSEEIFK